MKASKVIQLLSALSEKEIHKFRQFLYSEYHQIHGDIQRLFDYLAAHYPAFPDDKVNKITVFNYLYPSESIEKKPHKVKNRASDLSKLIEDFMLLKFVGERKLERALQVYYALKARNQNQLSLLQLNKISRLLEEDTLRNKDYHYYSFLVKQEYYYHPISTKILKGNAQENLESMISYLNTSYRLTYMECLCEVFTRKKLLGERYHFSLDNVDELEKSAIESAGIVSQMFGHALQLIRCSGEDIYSKLKKLFFENIDFLSYAEQEHLIGWLFNHQGNRLREGHTDALREMYALYQFGIPRKLYAKDNYMYIQHFLNAVVVATELKELDWLENFIQVYKDHLLPEVKENATELGMAYLRFGQKKYPETLRHTQQVKYKNNHAYSLPCWTLSIRSYYELQDKIDGVDDELGRFSNFIRDRKGITKDLVRCNQNFISVVRRLLRAAREAMFTTEELHEYLESKEQVICKKWLLEKIGELK